jgi:hypothetical protein
MRLLLVLIPILASASALGQQTTAPFAAWGTFYKITSSATMFPHPARDSGHTYDGVFYSAEQHYRDSSVAIFVPHGYKPSEETDLVVYVHGWGGNVDTSLVRYDIVKQFTGSGKNAILVHPEGPRNAPDSFGGKLESPGTFARLISDVLASLVARTIVPTTRIGSIILAGHSGAYRVLSFILLRGGLTDRIREVYLFDALYGQTEKFAYWIDHSRGRFVDIYTQDGGTKEETESLMEDLAGWGMPIRAVQETSLTPADLRENRLLFIFSDLVHNDVVMKREQFREFLQTSCLQNR